MRLALTLLTLCSNLIQSSPGAADVCTTVGITALKVLSDNLVWSLGGGGRGEGGEGVVILLGNTGWSALTPHGVSPEKNQIGAEAAIALSRTERGHTIT